MAEKRFAIVTGGTGALGGVVTEALLREGYQVAVFPTPPNAISSHSSVRSVPSNRK